MVPEAMVGGPALGSEDGLGPQYPLRQGDLGESPTALSRSSLAGKMRAKAPVSPPGCGLSHRRQRTCGCGVCVWRRPARRPVTHPQWRPEEWQRAPHRAGGRSPVRAQSGICPPGRPHPPGRVPPGLRPIGHHPASSDVPKSTDTLRRPPLHKTKAK